MSKALIGEESEGINTSSQARLSTSHARPGGVRQWLLLTPQQQR